MQLLCDIEADGLLDTISKIWCISIKDLSTGVNTLYGPDQIQEGLEVLSQADYLLAHNSIDFDFRALKKVTGWEPKKGAVLRDSLVWSKLTHLALDAEDRESKKAAIQELKGSHSLKSWGIRLGCHKGNYTGGWDAYTPEMGAYCQQDVEVLHELFKHLKQQWYTEEALELEHKARWRSVQMTERGFAFDVERANKLHEEIKSTLQGLEEKAKSLVAPVVSYEQQKKPAYWELRVYDQQFAQGVFDPIQVIRKPTRGECDRWRKDNKIKPKDCEFVAGPPGQKEIITHFNPGSRTQVRKYLFDRYGWVSPELTEKGEEMISQMTPVELSREYGKLSEDVLRNLDNEDGKLFADIFTARKVKGFLENEQGGGWLPRVKNGRIHHHMDTLGTVTCRCCHYDFNISQTPSVVKCKATKQPLWGLPGRYGADCRSLFIGTAGYSVVGGDLNAIEARVLAHWLYPYDGGRYCDLILNSDIHSANVESIKKIAGYTIERNTSKTPFYAFLYSAGKIKLGKTVATPVGGSKEAYDEFLSRRDFYRKNPLRIDTQVWSDTLQKRRIATPEEAGYAFVGSKMIKAFEQGIVGLPQLKSTLEEAVKKYGCIRVFDRKLPVRSAHSVLNTLFQGTAAIIGKRWLTSLFDTCEKNDVEAYMLVYSHDEVESDVRIGQEETYRQILLDEIKNAGEFYKMRLPLGGDCRIGKNWMDVH